MKTRESGLHGGELVGIIIGVLLASFIVFWVMVLALYMCLKSRKRPRDDARQTPRTPSVDHPLPPLPALATLDMTTRPQIGAVGVQDHVRDARNSQEDRLAATRRFYGLDAAPASAPEASAVPEPVRTFDRKLLPVNAPIPLRREESLRQVSTAPSPQLSSEERQPTPPIVVSRATSPTRDDLPPTNAMPMQAQTLARTSRSRRSSLQSLRSRTSQRSLTSSNPSRPYHIAMTPDDMLRVANPDPESPSRAETIESDGSSTLVNVQQRSQRTLLPRFLGTPARARGQSGEASGADRRASAYARQTDYYSLAHARLSHADHETDTRGQQLIPTLLVNDANLE